MFVVGDTQPVVMALGRCLDAKVGGEVSAAGWLKGVFAEISELVAVRSHDGLFDCVYLVVDRVGNYRSHAFVVSCLWSWGAVRSQGKRRARGENLGD